LSPVVTVFLMRKGMEMSWKCPECGASNEDAAPECGCGYSFHKVLGLKPGATEAEVRKAYQYLKNVWQSDRVAHDPVARKKAAGRMEQIEKAYTLFKGRTAGPSGGRQGAPVVKIAAASAVLMLCLVALFLYFRGPSKETTVSPGEQPAVAPALPRPEAEPAPAPVAGGEPAAVTQGAAPPESPGPSTAIEDEGERAIDLVKKSHALDRVFSVEAFVSKWAQESAGKMQVIGWQSKKMDDQVYVVSYTASDGLTTKGFYFDADLATGAVQDIARSPELQKKYGIQYK
jgi:hypothetical protein